MHEAPGGRPRMTRSLVIPARSCLAPSDRSVVLAVRASTDSTPRAKYHVVGRSAQAGANRQRASLQEVSSPLFSSGTSFNIGLIYSCLSRCVPSIDRMTGQRITFRELIPFFGGEQTTWTLHRRTEQVLDPRKFFWD